MGQAVLDELIKSAKENVLERLSSPLLGSFALSWCAWNYKFLMIVFSKNTITETVHLIDSIAYPNWMWLWGLRVAGPLFTALTYVFLYPYPARVIYAFTLKQQKRSNQLRQQIDDETPITNEEAHQIRVRHADHDRLQRRKISELQQEVADLQAALDAANEKPISADPEMQSTNELSTAEMRVLETISQAPGGVMNESDLSSSQANVTQAEYVIVKLMNNGLLARQLDGKVLFTPAGREIYEDSVKLWPSQTSSGTRANRALDAVRTLTTTSKSA